MSMRFDDSDKTRVLLGAPVEETHMMSPGNLLGQYVRVATYENRNGCGVNGVLEIVDGKYRVVHCPPGMRSTDEEIKRIVGVGKTIVFDDKDIFNWGRFREEDGRVVFRIELYRGPKVS